LSQHVRRHAFRSAVDRRGAKSQIVGAGLQDDTRLLRELLGRSGLCVGARKSLRSPPFSVAR
jgi:hypothetical protein